MNVAQLRRIYPFAGAKVDVFLAPLNAAMAEFDIITLARQASFIAQVGHESGQLRYVREIANGSAYEGRKDLGNTQPGDGVRFRGRALLQITGRINYKKCGEALGVDLIKTPELLEGTVLACRASAWWWKSHGLNELSDIGDQVKICKRVNGGTNGLTDRLALFKKASEVLGILAS